MKSTSTVAVPRRGSVIFAGFETNQGQSAIMNIKRSDGKGIPFAADIHDETNAIIGNVGQGGQAFVRGIQQQGTIKITAGSQHAQNLYCAVPATQCDIGENPANDYSQ